MTATTATATVEIGLDAEDLQTRVRDDKGLVGITDFSWLSHGTVGEFDGRVKYGRDAASGDARDVLWREKLREDRLRARGLEIVRWTWGRTPATRGDRPADPCDLAAGGAADARRLSARVRFVPAGARPERAPLG